MGKQFSFPSIVELQALVELLRSTDVTEIRSDISNVNTTVNGVNTTVLSLKDKNVVIGTTSRHDDSPEVSNAVGTSGEVVFKTYTFNIIGKLRVGFDEKITNIGASGAAVKFYVDNQYLGSTSCPLDAVYHTQYFDIDVLKGSVLKIAILNASSSVGITGYLKNISFKYDYLLNVPEVG